MFVRNQEEMLKGRYILNQKKVNTKKVWHIYGMQYFTI